MTTNKCLHSGGTISCAGLLILVDDEFHRIRHATHWKCFIVGSLFLQLWTGGKFWDKMRYLKALQLNPNSVWWVLLVSLKIKRIPLEITTWIEAKHKTKFCGKKCTQIGVYLTKFWKRNSLWQTLNLVFVWTNSYVHEARSLVWRCLFSYLIVVAAGDHTWLMFNI